MSSRTENYGLIMPSVTDFYNVEDFNSNASTIDSSMKEVANTASSALLLASAAKKDEYGVFEDSTSTAGIGYWFKLADIYMPNTSNAHFTLMLAVQNMNSLGSRYPSGLLSLDVSVSNRTVDPDYTNLKWVCADKSVTDYADKFAMYIDTTSMSNITASFFAYNAERYRSVKVTNVSSGSRVHTDPSLTSTYYSYSGHTGALVTLPTMGTTIYSTPGDYMYLLSSSVSSDSDATAATSKAVNTVYNVAHEAHSLASNAVSKSGSAMSGKLRISNGGLSIGTDSTLTGEHTLTQGLNCTAPGNYASAHGRDNVASGLSSFVMGGSNTAEAVFSTCMGTNNSTKGYAAIAGGMGTTANLCCEVVMGRWNIPSSGSNTSWASNGNAIVVGNGNNLIAANSFRVTNYGAVYALSAFNSTGADYAEYFEWLDGNTENEDRIGYFVTLENGKIRIANEKDTFILGAVSAIPGVIGNSYEDGWKDMYLTDKWGRLQYEDVSVPAVTESVYHDAVMGDDGEVISDAWSEEVEVAPACVELRLAVNPEYDPNVEYVPRSQRKEWGVVGMLGRIKVFNDGTCAAGTFCRPDAKGRATASESGYLVIEVNEDIAEILIR